MPGEALISLYFTRGTMLPLRIRPPVAALFRVPAVDVRDPGVGLVEALHRIVGGRHPGGVAVGHRVIGDRPSYIPPDQIVERLRRLLLVHRVGVDGCWRRTCRSSFSTASLAMPERGDIAGDGNRRQHADDHHDDHQLDQRKAVFAAMLRRASCPECRMLFIAFHVLAMFDAALPIL